MIRPVPALIALVLAVATIGVYAQTADFDFIEFDDDRYVWKHGELLGPFDSGAVAWAFEPVVRIANWQPVTLLSYRLDASRHGIADAGPYHVTNVAWHVLATLLLFGALRSLTGRDVESGLVAAVFALHPLHAESVAWVSSRKDVLVGAGWWASTWAYVGYVRSETRGRRWLAYSVSLLAFCFALLAKPLAVTLPFTLLLFDFWPLARVGSFAEWRSPRPEGSLEAFLRLVLEKLPFFALTMAACVVTLIVQREAGAMESGKALSLLERVGNALAAYWSYVVSSFWPTGLGVFYPHPTARSQEGLALFEVAAGGALLLVLAGAAVLAVRRRYASVAIGCCFFLGTLVPMIGLVQVGFASHADRYTYISQTGLAIALVFGASEWLRRQRPGWLPAGLALGVGACCALGIAGHRQVALWRDTPTLFEHTLSVTQRNDLIEYNYGTWLKGRGDVAAAKARFARALEWNPDKVDAAVNLGLLVYLEGDRERGLALLRGVLVKQPRHPTGHLNLGVALAQAEDWPAARSHFEVVLELEDVAEASEMYQAALSIATIDRVRGDDESAARYYERALVLRPDDVVVLGALSELYAHTGSGPNARAANAERAVELGRRAAELLGDSAESLGRLGLAYYAAGDRAAAAGAFDRAIARARLDDPARLPELESLRAALGPVPEFER